MTIFVSLLALQTLLTATVGSGGNPSPSAVPSGFKAVHYRPIAAEVPGLENPIVSLDGTWRINPKPSPDVREKPLRGGNWGNFRVPGQWLQQGYVIPRTSTAAVAKEFTIPAQWSGYRIFLRFDAIHAGTHYWLNGKPLGYSENLFTPVEWEITAAAKVGQTNRLDLEMKVDTASERLSCSSDYTCSGGPTKRSLGGIDRAVRIYALPKVHISSLHLNAGLDKTCQDGELHVELGLDNPGPPVGNGFAVTVQLFDAAGKAVEHSAPRTVPDPLKLGMSKMSIETRVARPLKWNAEQPHLYKLVLALEKDGRVRERVERNIGFRVVEIKGRQLYVNGARVKLAGVCRHEIDPLTERADTMRHGEEDVKLFKSGNLNFVRTSHYPCTQEFLNAADRYGLYVESEAPFCWVAPAKDLKDLSAVLTPTSAMIDYNHAHPSVIMWSLANESHWSGLFAESNKLCKQLDATRPTTLEHAFTGEDKETCDIISRHYQNLPYDEVLKNDPHPWLHGECFFLVYHERTDVGIDPGLREMWAQGNADPASDWGKRCIQNLTPLLGLRPGVHPGAWNQIYASKQCIGSTIWSGVDDITFLPGGKTASSEAGNAYWGVIDGWRRPKPELYLSRFVFSPVWFPVRQLDYLRGQPSVRVPVENRYAFTDLCKLDFVWELDGAKGNARLSLPPGAKGQFEVPIAKAAPEGATLLVRAFDGANEVVNAALSLGKRQPLSLPQPHAGAPQWSDDGTRIIIAGKGFSLALDRRTGDFDAANPKHAAPIASFPALHVTRYDFGDLAAYQMEKKNLPYAELPDAKTRVIESVTASRNGAGLEIVVKDHFANFAGAVRWLIDKEGVGKLSYDYSYSGPNLDAREVGLKALLRPAYDEVKWRRWSEWGVFPQESISRTEGSAKARRDKHWPDTPANVRPAWPWCLDQTALGTADFRAVKFNIYRASLVASDGSGIEVNADADAHFPRLPGRRRSEDAHSLPMHVGTGGVEEGRHLTGGYCLRLLAPSLPANGLQ